MGDWKIVVQQSQDKIDVAKKSLFDVKVKIQMLQHQVIVWFGGQSIYNLIECM